MTADDVKKFRQLLQEYAKMKKFLTERDLEIEVMKEIAATNGRRPVRSLQVTFATKRGLSQRSACALPSNSRSTLHYDSRMDVRHVPLIEAMTGLAHVSLRYGYRRIQVFMDHLGHIMRPDKTFGARARRAFRCQRSAS